MPLSNTVHHATYTVKPIFFSCDSPRFYVKGCAMPGFQALIKRQNITRWCLSIQKVLGKSHLHSTLKNYRHYALSSFQMAFPKTPLQSPLCPPTLQIHRVTYKLYVSLKPPAPTTKAEQGEMLVRTREPQSLALKPGSSLSRSCPSSRVSSQRLSGSACMLIVSLSVVPLNRFSWSL